MNSNETTWCRDPKLNLIKICSAVLDVKHPDERIDG